MRAAATRHRNSGPLATALRARRRPHGTKRGPSTSRFPVVPGSVAAGPFPATATRLLFAGDCPPHRCARARGPALWRAGEDLNEKPQGQGRPHAQWSPAAPPRDFMRIRTEIHTAVSGLEERTDAWINDAIKMHDLSVFKKCGGGRQTLVVASDRGRVPTTWGVGVGLGVGGAVTNMPLAFGRETAKILPNRNRPCIKGHSVIPAPPAPPELSRNVLRPACGSVGPCSL